MARGKKQIARQFCPDCGMALNKIDYLKSQASVSDFAFRKHCPNCRIHVTVTVKDQKNKS